MQSSNHIGKIVRQHAEAVEKGKPTNRKRKAKPKGIFAVAGHRAFVPLLTIWGALLLGLITMVAPVQVIASVPALTGVYLPLLTARLILALVIGCAGGLLGFIVASAFAGRAKRSNGDGAVVSAFKSRGAVEAINPIADLGSESLDAPIVADDLDEESDASYDDFVAAQEGNPALTHDTDHRPEGDNEPTLGELSKRGFEMDAPEEVENDSAGERKGEWAFTRKHFKDALIESCEGESCEAASSQSDKRPSQPNPPANPPANAPAPHREPRALDLGEFGALPGRNAVWVEEPTASAPPSEKTQAKTPAKGPATTPASALEKLRATPAEDLSLVEMVERFAAALHNHQQQERTRIEKGDVARETALAEALKALSLFTERGFDKPAQAPVTESELGQTEEELRQALARLQDMRGAA